MKILQQNANEFVSSKIFFIFWGNVIDIHIEKDPFQIPLTFSKLGFKVHYIINKYNIDQNTPSNISIYELMDRNIILKYIFIIEKIIKEKPKLIFLYSSRYTLLLNFILLFLKKFIKYKNIVKLDFNGKINELPYNISLSKIFYFLLIITSDIAIIESYQAKETLLSFYKGYGKHALQKKLYVLPNGLSSEFIRKIQEKLNSVKKEKKILVVSRIVERKGLYELILAISKINIKDWKIHIVGPIEDRDYYYKLLELINKLNLKDKIYFLGKISEEKLIEEYVSSQIFVLPSKTEGFSIARLEAMAACLPIVTTNTGGSEIVKNCCGIIIPVDDINALSEAIQLLIHNDELREKFSRNACEKIKEYEWENLLSNFLSYINFVTS
ncbi:glycosyltransferase family 4 protein [Saccharolobus caldissimus]|uniref:Glycosyl transferase family 1 domain-containing protein n=1 Tax=Saccharolobus caldissimus TaxID=1702097 RepID=A0AAQ4CVK7_9CREN|nr:glycosyltransferase family 4 protein [Saccharolobus caldissimus]BDB99838.1 hypothetical protein SACC_28550 [Saccharolobus caldissimus]